MPMLRPSPGSPLSSSQTQAVTTSPACRTPAACSVRSAPSALAIPAFRSAAPRPQIAPSTIAAAKGSSRSVPCQRSRQPSVRTVSRWPESSRLAPPPQPRHDAPATLQQVRPAADPPAEHDELRIEHALNRDGCKCNCYRLLLEHRDSRAIAGRSRLVDLERGDVAAGAAALGVRARDAD